VINSLPDLSQCVRCGGCKASCPTYQELPQEAMSARGRIMLLRALVSGEIKPSAALNDRIFSCILCGACSGSCPLGVDIREAIYKGRSILKETDRARKNLRSAVKFATRRPDLTFKMMKMGRALVLPALARRGIIPFVPELPAAPLRKDRQVFTVPRKRGRVAVFTGCSINYLFPQLGDSLIHVLQRFGYEVVLPKGETCCGAPLRSLGLEEEAAGQARKNLRVFGRLKVDAVLSLCPTCTFTLKTEYPKMIGDGLEKAMDISVFFRDKIDAAGDIGKTATYHDPCHLLHGLEVKNEPREIIRKAGMGLIEQANPGCCGFGGLHCFTYRDFSERLLQDRWRGIADTKAEAVVTSCPGCLLQLNRMVNDRPVLHLIELIEEAYCFRASADSQAPADY